MDPEYYLEDIDIYYGIASGQQKSALRRLEPEGVMMSYISVNNQPFEGDFKLFIDSGGFHHMATGRGEYKDDVEDYIEYVRMMKPNLWAFRDYPCEPELLEKNNTTVRENQRKTTEYAVELVDVADDVTGQEVVVLQGWEEHEYLEHLDELRDHGALTDYVGIGSICRRGSDREIADIILSIREELPSYCDLHAFGIKGNVMRFEEVAEAIDSMDSGAYDWKHSRHSEDCITGSYTWRDSARAYLNWRYNTLSKVGQERLEDHRTSLLDY